MDVRRQAASMLRSITSGVTVTNAKLLTQFGGGSLCRLFFLQGLI